MLSAIFTPICVECGKTCEYNELVCAECVCKLKEPEHRCMGCGHPSSADTYYCKRCDDKESTVDYYYTDFLYTDALRIMIRKIKYEWYFRGAKQLGSLCRVDEELLDGYDLIVPVPFHFRRRFARFIQPVDIIAAELATRTATPVRYALKRARHTEYQSRLSRKARLTNVKGAFELAEDVKNRQILLIDDILTTGATVREAAKLLKKGGAAGVDVYTLMCAAPRRI